MAFNYPPIDTNEKLQRYIDGDPKLTDGRSPFGSLPNSEKYTKFLGRFGGGGYQYNEFRIIGPRMVLESLEGIRFPERVINKGETKVLWIVNTNINRLDNANFPNLLELNLMRNRITSLNGVRFPESLRYLTIENEPIQTLEGVQFPSNLAELHISGSRITTIKGITFPSKLTSLNLSNNQIASFDGMKFPPLLEHLYLDNNPLIANIETISLLENPSETVIRDIVRAYPQTAEYFEQQKESDKLVMGKLQNHIRSIAAFLQPLIVERKAKEEAKLTEGIPRLFVVNASNNNTYTIPFIASQTVQTAIDYLEENYLLSVTNSYVKIKLTKRSDNTVLDPLRTFADFSIQNEDTLNVVQDNSPDAVRVSRGGKHQHKTKRKRKPSRSGRR